MLAKWGRNIYFYADANMSRGQNCLRLFGSQQIGPRMPRAGHDAEEDGEGEKNIHIPEGSIPAGSRRATTVSLSMVADGEKQLDTPTDRRAQSGEEDLVGRQQQDEGVVPMKRVSKDPEGGKTADQDLGVSFAKDLEECDVQMKGTDEVVEDADGDGEYPVEVFLGLFYHSGRLGIAVYDEGEATLSICQMKDGYAEMEGLRTVLYQVKPTLVVTNAKPDKEFEQVLLAPGDGLEYNLAFAPTRNFKYASCRAQLVQLELDIFDGLNCNSTADKRRRINSEIDLEAREAVSAAGGLLQHLQSNRLIDDLSDTHVVRVTRVKSLRLDKFLSIDSQTLSSLQIFHLDAHPSISGCGPSKEGLSLFSLLDNTKSPLGKSLLRLWFLRPLLDESDIHGRLMAVRFFTNPSCHDLVGALRNQLRGLKDVPRIMIRIRKATASVNDWSNLSMSLAALFQLREACVQFDEDMRPAAEDVPSIFNQVKDEICPRIHNLEVMLSSMVDFPLSVQKKRIAIQEGICDELDEVKRRFEGLSDFLHDVALEEMNDLPQDASDIDFYVMFVPQLGYMVTCPNDDARRTLEVVQGYKLNFATSEMAYFKTPRMEELDSNVGDIYAAICDREFQLAEMIRKKMLEWHSTILDACGLAAEMDCVLGFAVAAMERDLKEPSIVKESVLYIEEGRHPLCELCANTFVPNNTALDAGSPESSGLLIVTGANFSGKSIYMKQTALIAFMAHIGSFVPAMSCQVGLIDRIFSRVQSRESCSESSSSFAIDLNQVSTMLRASTCRSLLLIDEFGKGTQPEDGVSLLAASIRQLVSRGQDCPRTVVVTHHSELFTVSGILPPSSEASIAYGTMSVMLEAEQGQESNRVTSERSFRNVQDSAAGNVVFLYRLVEGRSSKSHGYECALSAGVPHAVVERARAVSHKLRNHEKIERVDSDREREVKKCFEAAVAMLQHFDAENGDVKGFLARIALLGEHNHNTMQ